MNANHWNAGTRLPGLMLALALLLVSLLTLAPARAVYAAGFTVTTLDDSGSGSLREAIEQATAQAGADTIHFDVTGTIVLASTLPTINDELIIEGPGASKLTISGNHAVRVFSMNGGTLNLSGVTVADGNTSDVFYSGGITNDNGTLTISNSTFSGNSGDSGGAISTTNGTVTISNSTFSDNSAPTFDGTGGAIFAAGGTVTISTSTFSGNTAPSTGAGGAIFTTDTSTVTISNSTFSDNSTPSGAGGAIFNNGTVTISASTFAGNSAPSHSGGAIFNNGTATISTSIFSGNSTASFGGSGGAIYNNGTVMISNSTFAGNSAPSFGGSGGAIFNGGTATISTSTFSGNTVPSFGGDGGAIFNTGTVTVKHTIIANSGSGGNCSGTLSDSGGNLSSDATCGLTADSSRNNVDPQLDPNGPQDNGGPTKTIALLPGSPAIDAIPATDCDVSTDQRGYVRPIDGDNNGTATCDIGAYEYNSTPSDTTAPTASPTQSPAANSAHWNKSDVIATWNWADGGSGIDSNKCISSSTSSGEGKLTLSATCADLAGNQGSASYDVNVDKTAPSVSITGVTNGASYTLGAVPTAACSTADTLSEVATAATLSISGGNPDGTGSFTASCSGATDQAGNSAPEASVSYTVAYRWSGFSTPVDNPPTLNSVKAGNAVPVKFSLGGNYGLNIIASGYPKVQQVTCGSAPTDEVEQTVTTGASGLQYDAATGQYTYTWKTDKKWAGTCRQLVLKLIDGSDHVALFQFK